MKDPLQSEATPYEVLGVARGASSDEVDRGFREGLVQRQNVAKLTAARRTLQNPVERGLLDAFLYDPVFLAQMRPDPSRDTEALGSERRDQTGVAWARILRERFPDIGPIHCYSVYWYWSAVGSTGAAPAVSICAWTHAVAGWSALLASDAFRARLTPPHQDAVAARIEERLRSALRDLHQAESGAGRARDAAAYRNLEIELDAELRTARRVAAFGFRIGRGTLSCGRLLLGLNNLTEPVRRHLDAALQTSPSDESLLGLREALFSGVARAESLIEGNDPEQAIRVIEGLPTEERATPGMQATLARALHAVGRRHADVGRPVEALEAWAKALAVDTGELAGKIEVDVVSLCLSCAGAWQVSRRDEAIALLEQGLGVCRSLKLQQTLGELVAQRGIARVNEILRAADFEHRGHTPELVAPLRAGLADLDKAALLGSQRAQEQAQVVRTMIARSQRAHRRSRQVEFNSMPLAARRRFAACATGKAKPAPLVAEVTPGGPAGPIVGMLFCGAMLLVTVVAGFGAGGRGGYHGFVALGWYTVVSFGLFAALLGAVKAQVERRSRPFPFGRYLFPLDVVDARGSRLHIHPTSDLEKFEPIHHHNAGKYVHTSLVFQFKDKARFEFRVQPQARAQEVLQALQEARNAEEQALTKGDAAALRDIDLFQEVS
jgi:hypothetical protein